jgi:hypothetical protein
MGRFALAQLTTDGTTGAAAWEIRAGAQGALLRELDVALVAATATVIGVGRPAAIGITPTTPVLFLAEKTDEATTPTAQGAFAWGTGPTIPAAFFKRLSLPAAIGAGLRWTWEKGLIVPAGGSIVIWNLAANSVLNVSAVVEQ